MKPSENKIKFLIENLFLEDGLLSKEDSYETIPTLKKDVPSILNKIEEKIQALRDESKLDWLSEAKKKNRSIQNKFANSAKSIESWSSEKLKRFAEAIRSGKGEFEGYRIASAHFRDRNIEQLSEDELRELIRDSIQLNSIDSDD